MKKITYSAGQYSQLRLNDGTKIFVETLPESIRVKKLLFGVIPTKKIWEFAFPFYIRTAVESWGSSKEILDIVLETIEGAENLQELKKHLYGDTSKALRNYVKEHGDEASDISTDKVGMLALKQISNPKSLRKIETIVHEYGKVMEKTAQEMPEKYPAAVFPQSLLPYSKETIKKSLESFIMHTEDEGKIATLKLALDWLAGFIGDKEASERNNKLLNSPQFIEALRKNRKKHE